MVEELNKLLSDLNVFYRKLQNYHWNIKGHDFFVVHEKLEEYYNCINEQIDEVAEHILILGGQPLGRMKDYLQISTIQEANNEKLTSDVIYKNVTADITILLNLSKEIKKLAEEKTDYATSSLIDEYISDYSKKLWMLTQMLEK